MEQRFLKKMKHISRLITILTITACLTGCSLFSLDSESDPIKNQVLQEAEQIQTVYWTLKSSDPVMESDIVNNYKAEGYSNYVIERAKELYYNETMKDIEAGTAEIKNLETLTPEQKKAILKAYFDAVGVDCNKAEKIIVE